MRARRDAEVAIGFGEIGLQLNRPLEDPNRIVVQPLGIKRQAGCHQRFRMVWTKLQRDAQLLQRGVRILHIHQQRAEIEMCIGKLRPQRDRARKCGRGMFKPAQLAEGDAEIDPCFGKLRLVANRRLIRRDRFLAAINQRQHVSEIAMHLCKIGARRKSAAIRLDRILVLIQRNVRRREVRQRLGNIRLHRHRFAITLQRLLMFFLRRQRDADQRVQVRHIGAQRRSISKASLGVDDAPGGEKHLAEPVEDLRAARLKSTAPWR